MLEHLSVCASGLSQTKIIQMAAGAKLLKKTYMTQLLSPINNTASPHTHLMAHSLKTWDASLWNTEVPDVKSRWEEFIEKGIKPLGLSGSHLLPIKRAVNSILRQDAMGKQPKGISVRWRVHRSMQEWDLWVKKICWFHLTLKREWHSLFFDQRENRGSMEVERSGDRHWKRQWGKDNQVLCVRGSKTRMEKAEGNRVGEIQLSELQHSRMWHVESRKRKLDRYRLVW